MPHTRRKFLQSTLAAPLAFTSLAASFEKPAQHEIIDIHCHPRWLGHSAAKMIENMDDAGINRAWLISWEAPEREISPNYYAATNPLEVGIPFRDVVELCEQYPDRFIPGTTVDPRDPQRPRKTPGSRRNSRRARLRRIQAPHAIRRSRMPCASFSLPENSGLPVIFHLDVNFPAKQRCTGMSVNGGTAAAWKTWSRR